MLNWQQGNMPVSKKGVGLHLIWRQIKCHWNHVHFRYQDEPVNGETRPVFGEPVEPLVECPVCGQAHEQIHLAWRKPAGTFGHFIVFWMNGEKIVPDLSIPIDVARLPRDARRLSPEENAKAWHGPENWRAYAESLKNTIDQMKKGDTP